MPVWLTGILAQIAEYFMQKLIDWGIKEEKQREADAAIDQKTAAECNALKKAKTNTEVDDAAKDTLNGV